MATVGIKGLTEPSETEERNAKR